jgi:hypothetical protein
LSYTKRKIVGKSAMCKTKIIYNNSSTIFTYIFGKNENKKNDKNNIGATSFDQN